MQCTFYWLPNSMHQKMHLMYSFSALSLRITYYCYCYSGVFASEVWSQICPHNAFSFSDSLLYVCWYLYILVMSRALSIPSIIRFKWIHHKVEQSDTKYWMLTFGSLSQDVYICSTRRLNSDSVPTNSFCMINSCSDSNL